MTVTTMGKDTGHPLAALTAEEILAATDIVRADARWTERWRFAYVGLEAPPKATVRGFTAGDPVDRLVRMQIVAGPEAHVIEMVVSVTTGDVRSYVEMEGMRPGLLFEESLIAIVALKESPQWQAAMRRRGIEDFDSVQIDPWPAGSFDNAHETGRRICRCLSYVRETPDDNGYARPVEGVIGFVDMARGEVLEILDTGVIPLPPEKGSYYPEDNGPLRQDLKPLEITQPEGPSWAGRGQPGAMAAMVAAGDHGPGRRSRSPRRGLRGRRPGTQHPLPCRGERDGGALRRSRSHARVEERLRRRRMGSRADGQLAHPRL